MLNSDPKINMRRKRGDHSPGSSKGSRVTLKQCLQPQLWVIYPIPSHPLHRCLAITAIKHKLSCQAPWGAVGIAWGHVTCRQVAGDKGPMCLEGLSPSHEGVRAGEGQPPQPLWGSCKQLEKALYINPANSPKSLLCSGEGVWGLEALAGIVLFSQLCLQQTGAFW